MSFKKKGNKNNKPPREGEWWKKQPKQWFHNVYQTLGWPQPLYNTRYDVKQRKFVSTVILPENLGKHYKEFISVESRTITGTGRDSKQSETAAAQDGCSKLAPFNLLDISLKNLPWRAREILKDSKENQQQIDLTASINGRENAKNSSVATQNAASASNPKTAMNNICQRYGWVCPRLNTLHGPLQNGLAYWRCQVVIPEGILKQLETQGISTDFGGGRGLLEKSAQTRRSAENATMSKFVEVLNLVLTECWWLETPKQVYHNAVQGLMPPGKKATFALQNAGRGRFMSYTVLPDVAVEALAKIGHKIQPSGRVTVYSPNKKFAERNCAAEACRLLFLIGKLRRIHCAGTSHKGSVHPFAVPFPREHRKGPSYCDKPHELRHSFRVTIPEDLETKVESIMDRIPGLERGTHAHPAPYPTLPKNSVGLDFFSLSAHSHLEKKLEELKDREQNNEMSPKENDVDQLPLPPTKSEPPPPQSSEQTQHLDFCTSSTNGQNYLDSTPLMQTVQNSHSFRDRFKLNKMATELQTYLQTQQTARFQQMLVNRRKLSAYEKYNEVMQTVKNHQVSLISGETGCGKTTQVPQFILDDLLVETVQGRRDPDPILVVVTQPRQIAAVSVAQRVAQERCESLGDSVGYQIRLQRALPQNTASILYCTTGIVLRKFANDNLLSKVTHLIVDEIHERDLDSDFLLVLLRDLLPKRPDLRVTLMSATLDAHQFISYFSSTGLMVPLCELQGRMFPVDEYYLEDILERMVDTRSLIDNASQLSTGSARFGRRGGNQGGPGDHKPWLARYRYKTRQLLETFEEDDLPVELAALIVEAICEMMPVSTVSNEEQNEAILIFMPGIYEIRELDKVLKSSRVLSRHKTLVIPLHSQLNQQYQKDVFERPPAGTRKIVIATNIAETSITIDDVVYVINSGKLKQKMYDHETRISSLETVWCSKANNKQRAGRAGRVRPGICYHLMTKWRAGRLADHSVPEMQRVALEDLTLTVKALNIGDVEAVLSKAMQAPNPECIQDALQVLRGIGALDEEDQITLLGHHLAKLPIEPRTGKMIILGVIFKCLDPLLTIAASMSGKDPFLIPYYAKEEAMEAKKILAGDSQSDHYVLVQAYNGWRKAMSESTEQDFLNKNFLSPQAMNSIHRIKQQFIDVLSRAGFQIESTTSWKHELQTAENPLEQNKYQNNLPLIKGVLTAGLSPNIFRIIEKQSKGSLKLMTVDNCEITPRQQSVMKGETDMDKVCKLGIYQEKFKTKNVFLDTCSTISPLTLLLFADRPVVFEPPPSLANRLPKDTVGLVVDGWVSFVAERKVAECLMDLRAAIDALLCQSFGEADALTVPKEIADQLVDTVSKLLVTELSEGEVHEETSLSVEDSGGGRKILEGGFDTGPSYASIEKDAGKRKRPMRHNGNGYFNQANHYHSMPFNNKMMRMMPPPGQQQIMAQQMMMQHQHNFQQNFQRINQQPGVQSTQQNNFGHLHNMMGRFQRF